MKKILSLAMALCLCLSLGVTAFAAEVTINGNQSVDTTVTYGVEEGYTVTIPETIVIATDTHKGEAEVKAANVLLADSVKLTVTLSGYEELVDVAAADNTLSYKIGKTLGASDVTNGTVVLEVESADNWNSEATQTLYFELTEDVTKAGTYSDGLTFTVDVVPA